MPHRRTLLLAGLSLLLLAPPSLAQTPPRTKTPGPRSHSFPVDPALLTPEQRAKIAQAAAPSPPAPAPASAMTRRLGTGPAGPIMMPTPVTPAERAVLEARSKAKLEIYRQGPRHRQATVTRATPARPPAWKPRSRSTAGTVQPGLTPAERAKAEAAGIRVLEEVRR